MSDIFIWVLTIIVILNILLFLIVASKNFLEENLNIIQIDYILKVAAIYMVLPLPCIIGYILFEDSFRKIISIEGNEISALYIIHNRPLSVIRDTGNHKIFLLMFLLWLVGVICFGVCAYIRNIRFLRKIEEKSFLLDDKSELFNAIKYSVHRELGAKKRINIYINDIMPSPFTIGIIHKKIFLPKKTFSIPQYELMLKHELTHCLRNDFFFRIILSLLCSAYWFNPFIHKYAKYFIDINEIACDEISLNNVALNERIMYAELILYIAENNIALQNVPLLTGKSISNIERRIIQIMKKQNPITLGKKIIFSVSVMTMLLTFPITTLACAKGVSELQNRVTENLMKNQKLVTITDKYTEKETLEQIETSKDIVLSIMPKGASWIEVTINGRELVMTNTVYLSAGNEVVLSFAGKNSNDKFRAGLINRAGKKIYVESSNGKVDHRFQIREKDDYVVFIEGTTNNKVSISGSVTVFN